MPELSEQPMKHGFSSVRAAARLSVAPMMDWTDRHCRYLHRLLSRETLLYTEMVTAPALVRGGAMHLLDFSPQEHPVALQLGGSDPEELAQAARLGAEAGYDEINLNCGCPSDRVQSGTFGAVLMKDPGRVAECVAAMRSAVTVEVTVKCRIGVDDQDPEEVLPEFLSRVGAAGCERFIIHARKTWLEGLSPKENREIPPLKYEVVHQLKRDFPQLEIILNGGLTDLDVMQAQLAHVDGVMVGREAYHNPWLLSEVDRRFFGDDYPLPSRIEVMALMRPYIERHIAAGGQMHHITRHMLGLFQGLPGARHFRRELSTTIHRTDEPLALYDALLEQMQARVG